MKRVKRLGMLVMMMAATMTVGAQDNVAATVSADVVNQYIWRGTQCGEASIQPTLGVSYKGLSLTAWGSTEMAPKSGTPYCSEFDLTLGYSVGGFNVGVTDYWFSRGGDAAGRYFMYESHRTNHMFEANIGYDFGPVSVQWYTIFAGDDYKKVADDGTIDRAYSSYVEVAAPFTLGGLDWNAAIGASPLKTQLYCNDGFAVTNISLKASKDIVVTPSFSIPVFAQVVANPADQKSYFVFGFTLKP